MVKRSALTHVRQPVLAVCRRLHLSCLAGLGSLLAACAEGQVWKDLRSAAGIYGVSFDP
jgi:hypothetical protein